MKIQIDHYTPVPTHLVIGCEGALDCEKLKIEWGREWKKLKKSITFYPSDDESDSITADCKGNSVKIPARVYEKAGICRYVITGESPLKRIVSKTGYMTVLSAPEKLEEKQKNVKPSKAKGETA